MKGSERTPREPLPISEGLYADEVALERALARGSSVAEILCHACDRTLEDPPGRSGLFVFVRGDHTAREEPPLCEECATAIGVTSLWRMLDDEGDE